MSDRTLMEQFVKGGLAAQEAVDAEVAKQQPRQSPRAVGRPFRITKKARAILGEINSATDRFDEATTILADKTVSHSLAMKVGRDKMQAERLLVSLTYRLSYEVRGKKLWHER